MKQVYANTVFYIFNSRTFRHQYHITSQVSNAIEDYLSQVSETNVRIHKGDEEITLTELMNITLKHSSWFNYDLLQFLVDRCGGEEEKKLLKCYLHSPLHCYQELSIVKVPPESYDYKGSSETHKREVYFELPSAYSSVVITGQDLRHVTTLLREKLDQPLLMLRRYEEQGTELYFGIPDKEDLVSRSSSFSHHTEWDEENEMYYVTSDIL